MALVNCSFFSNGGQTFSSRTFLLRKDGTWTMSNSKIKIVSLKIHGAEKAMCSRKRRIHKYVWDINT